MKQKDVVIIGAGIIGLATAYQIQKLKPNWKIQVLEKECKAALHQTGRNSGVIHSGIYYKPGSLKAKNCIEGKEKLLEFCNTFSVPFKKVGKLIVATQDTQIAALHDIYERGRANGLKTITLLSAKRAKEIEPFIRCIEAVWVPECSVVDYSVVANTIAKQIQEKGAQIQFSGEVINFKKQDRTVLVQTKSEEYACRKLINCAGLYSDRIAKFSYNKLDCRIIPFRGEYYEVRKEVANKIHGLVYPVKDPRFPFLGVHLTKMIQGSVEAGPNAVLAFAREGYKKNNINFSDMADILRFSGFWKLFRKYWKVGVYEWYRSLSKRAFLRDLQQFMPSLKREDLKPYKTGIRAQIVMKDGSLLDDFYFLEEENIVHVLNAPSPAATSCFSIAENIARKVV